MSESCLLYTSLGAVCGLLHDIGKYSGAFQARIRARNAMPR